MSPASDELQELLAERDRFDARLAASVAEFDRAGGWELDGATSMQAWLRHHARMTSGAAAQLVSRARRTAVLPVTAAAWASGELSTGQVDVILAHVRTDTALFASHEASVVPTLVPLTVNETATAMQKWRELADAELEAPKAEEPPSRVHLSSTLDGRGALDGDLDADGHAIVATALRVAEMRDERPASERRAEALVDVCRFFLDNQQTHRGGRHRPHVNLIVDLHAEGGRVVGGPTLPTSIVERYCCDSTMHRVLTDGRSVILDLGVATRVVSAALWVAVVARDEHCRFPGCDRPATWCDAHHVRWVRHGGATRLDNLVLLCRRHHTLLHKPGWHAKLLPDATVEVTDPDGGHRTSRPPGLLLRR